MRPDDVDARSVLSVFRVPKEAEGQRLDVFLVTQFRRTSRTRAQEIIRVSAYDDAGKRMRANDRLAAEQRVCLWRAPWDEAPVPTHVPVLFEDDYFLGVDKPSGLPVHPTARYFNNTLIKVLEREREGQFLTLIHRIDRETSGVLLVGKTAEADRAMKKKLEERDDVEKTYVAITWGIPNLGDGSRAFRYAEPVELDPTHKTGVKMRIAASGSGLSAATRFSIEEIRGTADAPYALVRCDLETGRQHQIRIHLSALGTPVVGDKLYGPDDHLFERGVDGELTPEDHLLLELPRHALHAAKLSFVHPFTKARVAIEAPLPDDLAAFLSALPVLTNG